TDLTAAGVCCSRRRPLPPRAGTRRYALNPMGGGPRQMKSLRLIIVTLALTAVLAALAFWRPGSGGDPGDGSVPVDRTIEITARQFSYTPDTVRVGLGERVRLVLRTEDVAHGLAVREYGINLVATPGDAASAVFTADRPGRFPMYCTVYCGTGHPEHLGTLIVGDGEDGEQP